MCELAGDVAAVAAALTDDPVVLVGHDWGAPIAWSAAIRHPDRVRAVAGLSVPHTPALPVSLVDVFDQLYQDRFFYMLYFQEPGVAEAAFGADLPGALKRAFFGLSGDAPDGSWLPDAPRDAPFLDLLPDPPDDELRFLPDLELDVIATTFERTGMTGAFNRHRALPFDVATSADVVGASVDQPACFIGGARDPVRWMVPGVDSYADPGAGCTDFRGATIVPGAGHWVQHEACVEVDVALDAFLDSL